MSCLAADDASGAEQTRKSKCCPERCLLMKALLLGFTHYLGLSHVLILLYVLKSIGSSSDVVAPPKQVDPAERVDPVEQVDQDDSFPSEIKEGLLEHLEYEHVFQLKLLSRGWKSSIDENIPTLSLKKLPSLTACYFYIHSNVWQWAGFDSSSGKWRRLPPLTFLPTNCNPDPDLFKQFLISSKNGLVCMNFSKSPHEEWLIVFNPLTRRWKELPPLLHRRNPVLMHMIMDEATHSYQILVAGSSAASDEQLSRITEFYDSRTERWTRVGDLPGPAFALNDYQAGVFQNGNIFCIGFMELDDQVVKGILGFNMAKRAWSTKWTNLPLPSSPILQLVEYYGGLYLFSEHKNGQFIEHRVDRVEWTEKEKSITLELVNVITAQKIGSWSLEVYPEFALVPYSKSQLCIYNTVSHTGEIYDIEDQERFEVLEALPEEGFSGDLSLFTLNPMTFTLEPRFSTKLD